MTIKDHYDNHLGNFYTWYTGNFETNKNVFRSFCTENKICPIGTGIAIDLGAGAGIQSVALAELGFKVKAIDFNNQLLTELQTNSYNFDIEILNDDLRNIENYANPKPELIVCCGDTLAHLESCDEVQTLIAKSFEALVPRGKIILSFRDYSTVPSDIERFIPVKSDNQKILTCFVEYFDDKIRVTDLLHEYENGKWVQKVSSYFKTRITQDFVIKSLENNGFTIIGKTIGKGMVSIIASK